MGLIFLDGYYNSKFLLCPQMIGGCKAERFTCFFFLLIYLNNLNIIIKLSDEIYHLVAVYHEDSGHKFMTQF